MSRKILLTSVSVLAFSAAAYAEFPSEASFLPEHNSLTRPHLKGRHEMKENDALTNASLPKKYYETKEDFKKIDLSSEKSLSSEENLKNSFLTSSTVFVDEKKADHQNIKQPLPINKPLAGFTIDQTIQYGKLAQLAYANVVNPEQDASTFAALEKMQAGGNRVQFFGTEVENSGLIVTHADGRVSVVYKGTSSLQNLATDAWANFAIDDHTGLRCHNGIMKGFYRTKDQLFEILEQIAGSRGKTVKELLENDVTVTGHSLGGGLSQMFMGYALKNHAATPKAVTFATPRVFDVASALEMDNKFENRYQNIMQVTDPVTGIALGALGYKHFGTKIHVPYSKAHWQHTMSGYLRALETLGTSNEIKVGATSFTYEESQRTGLGNAKWIGNTSIPNPLYPLHHLRQGMAQHVDPVVHKVIKTVKDGARGLMSGVASAAQKTGNAFSAAASHVGVAAQKAWGRVRGQS